MTPRASALGPQRAPAGGDGNAEVDLTVEEHHRGWLGPLLLDELVDVARDVGIRNLVAEILTSNRSMLALVRRRGCVTMGHVDASIVVVAIATSHEVPVWPTSGPDHDDLPRVVIEGRALPLEAETWARSDGIHLIACHIAADAPARCPALRDEPCALAAASDAVVVAGPDPAPIDALLAAHRRLHPGVVRCTTAIAGSGPVAGTGATTAAVEVGPLGVRAIDQVAELVRARRASGAG